MERNEKPALNAKYQVKQAIVAYLRAAILSGELRPGHTLHESALTKQFGASRSPIREALVQLEQEGLVTTFPKKGSVVTTIDKTQLRQALFIRSSLEATNIELLAQNISDEQVSIMKANIERQRNALLQDDYSEMYDAMDEFHLLLCDFNELPRIWELIRREKVPLDRLHALNQPHSPRMSTLFNQHIEIVKALEERDSEKCSSLIRTHADIDFEAMNLVKEEKSSAKEVKPTTGRSVK
ncbi:MAG: GntR family transcriptional regulator [Actinobacteria bacterium]|nr:GntR family transcriptional regulator [Actinomycetota bacterium]